MLMSHRMKVREKVVEKELKKEITVSKKPFRIYAREINSRTNIMYKTTNKEV